MASNTSFLGAIAHRRTIYDLEPKSTIPDARIVEIVEHITRYVPSSFNCQAARFLVLLGAEHKLLWSEARVVMAKVIPSEVFNAYFDAMITKYSNGYGTILCFEDQDSIQQNITKYEGIIPREKFEQWSEHSAGMHQHALWCALEAEGLGANLQHYNPNIDDTVEKTWGISAKWSLKAQLVFGVPAPGTVLKEKAVKPLDERILVKGGTR